MSSLNSVVNKLVRAAASVSTEISDADLDAHVARILAEEAKANDSKWSELGLGPYLKREQTRGSPDPNAPKPNKRFLSSIIRQVDGHNNALLRQQAEAVRQAQRAREPVRKARGDGKTGANRLFGGALRGLGDRERKPSRSDRRERDGRDREERKVDGDDHSRKRQHERDRDCDRRHGRKEEGRDHRHRERSRSRSRSPRRRRHSDDDDERKTRRRYDSDNEERRPRRPEQREHSCDDRHGKERDLSHEHRSEDRRRRRDRPRSLSHRRETERSKSHRDRDRGLSRSPSPRRSPPAPPARSRTRTTQDADDRPREPSSSPPPPPSRISRMDRYFKRDYDPRLDIGKVPKTGPVTARRRNSPTLSSSPEPERKARPSDLPPKPAVNSMPAEMKDIMGMEYTLRGQTRAWDVGKDTSD
ncbi:hypothetical protein CspHIS471_0307050 [Cutaneotrichosporon sp. HIS471]|nr:hypothetical protein CspHIS471_0307050 [Cutaneotrichosporon sp. HIS471]